MQRDAGLGGAGGHDHPGGPHAPLRKPGGEGVEVGPGIARQPSDWANSERPMSNETKGGASAAVGAA